MSTIKIGPRAAAAMLALAIPVIGVGTAVVATSFNADHAGVDGVSAVETNASPVIGNFGVRGNNPNDKRR